MSKCSERPTGLRNILKILFVVDTDRGGASLNNQTAYVGPTRGRQDIWVYTNDKERMVRDLSRDRSNTAAIEQPTHTPHRSMVVAVS